MNTVLYDITLPIHDGMPVYEGDDPIVTKKIITIEESGICNITGIQNFSTHFGTHVDPPLHFVDKGKNLDEVDIQRFIGKAIVVTIKNSDAITAKELKDLKIEAGINILFHTRNSNFLASSEFHQDHVYIEKDAAEYLAAKKVNLVGIDYLSVDKFGDEDYPAHRTLLKNGVIVLEAVNLIGVPDGIYNLICLPLRIKGADGSPARALLAQFP